MEKRKMPSANFTTTTNLRTKRRKRRNLHSKFIYFAALILFYYSLLLKSGTIQEEFKRIVYKLNAQQIRRRNFREHEPKYAMFYQSVKLTVN